jgi:hypothetical protein
MPAGTTAPVGADGCAAARPGAGRGCGGLPGLAKKPASQGRRRRRGEIGRPGESRDPMSTAPNGASALAGATLPSLPRFIDHQDGTCRIRLTSVISIATVPPAEWPALAPFLFERNRADVDRAQRSPRRAGALRVGGIFSLAQRPSAACRRMTRHGAAWVGALRAATVNAGSSSRHACSSPCSGRVVPDVRRRRRVPANMGKGARSVGAARSTGAPPCRALPADGGRKRRPAVRAAFMHALRLRGLVVGALDVLKAAASRARPARRTTESSRPSSSSRAARRGAR